MKTPSLLEMLKAGAHFGHQKSRWHPKMADYIFTQRHGIHIIDLQQTQKQMEATYKAVKDMVAAGKNIVFVSTKPQAKAIVQAAAKDCGMPYLTSRWIGGLLTNFPEIKKRIRRYNELKSQQASGELEKYTKKEQLDIAKELEKMDETLAGLTTVNKMPDAIFVPAVQREKTAMTEAIRTGVDVVGICDTNANPQHCNHFIAANDDAVKSIEMMVHWIAEAVKEGKKELEKKQTIDKKAAATEEKK